MGALDGVRIVEMDAIGPVPLAATLLADMGADIVRIARPAGNPLSDMGSAVLHRGRSSIRLDLKSSEGREHALALISRADALIEGFRPGVMERLGLGPELCHRQNPRLVYGRMTGWGQTGPRASEAGHDINYIAIAGALGLMGEDDRPPMPPLNLIGDYGAGSLFLAVGVLAGIISARASGAGQVVDAAMTDGTAMLLSMFTVMAQQGSWSNRRGDNLLDGGAPFYRCYGCADGRYVAVGAIEPQFFASLLDGLGIEGDRYRQMDRSGWSRMAEDFAAAFARKPRDHWTAQFAGTDACVTPVLALGEAFIDRHNAERGTYVSAGGAYQPAPAPRFSATPSAIRPADAVEIETVLARWT